MDDQNQQTLPPQQPTIPLQNVNPIPPPQQSLYGKRNWLKWVLIYLIIAVLIYGGIYYLAAQQKKSSLYSTNSPTPTIIPSPTPDLTANWKTYINEGYEYLFKYPEQTSIDDKNKDYIWLDDQISIHVTSKDPEGCQGACPVIQERKNIEINGVNAKELNGGFGVIGGNVPHRFQSVVIPHNNQYYVIMVYEIKHDDKILSLSPVREVGDIPESQLKLFHQILSTFRFTQ